MREVESFICTDENVSESIHSVEIGVHERWLGVLRSVQGTLRVGSRVFIRPTAAVSGALCVMSANRTRDDVMRGAVARLRRSC
jgi:hypothetical protein